MKLSEAIKIGSSLRPESHQGPFCRIANLETLASDVWGAACEAVHSLVAKRNWDKLDPASYDADIEYLRGIQQKYFADYFKMPATCPGAQPRNYIQEGVRVVNRRGEYVREGERQKSLPPVTSACPSVTNLAELIEHIFYVHNWSREECAQAVEWYEEARDGSLLIRNFAHYQAESLRQQISQRVNLAARQRERQRMAKRRVWSSN